MPAGERGLGALPRARARGSRSLALVAALALALLPAPAAAAPPAGSTAAPKLDAASWILVDRRDGERLAARSPAAQRSIASTTKLMTAYLALERLGLDQRLKVPAYSPAPAESVAGLMQGERLTVRDLLLAMMLPSANDAAETVAVGVGGSVPRFVAQMNRAASRLGLEDTSYANPIGLDAIDNYSSAADLASLAGRLLDDKRFRKIVAKPEADLSSGATTRHVVTRNTLLLSDPSVDGVKTGHTIDAGYVLVASARRDGVPLLSVVLGAPSEAARDAESEELLDYGYSLYEPRSPFKAGAELASAEVRYSDQKLALVAKRRVAVESRADQELTAAIDAPDEVEGPVTAGAVLGRATVSLDGKVVGRVPVVAAADVAAPSFLARVGGARIVAAVIGAVIVIMGGVALMARRRGSGSSEGRRNAEERMQSQRERTRRRADGGG